MELKEIEELRSKSNVSIEEYQKLVDIIEDQIIEIGYLTDLLGIYGHEVK